MKKQLLSSFTLIASFSTLICCALPALLVTLGLGATLASIVSAVPELIWLSEHKKMLFSLTGILLTISWLSFIYARNRSCPTDARLAEACKSGRNFTLISLIISSCIFIIGVFFAFLLPII